LKTPVEPITNGKVLDSFITGFSLCARDSNKQICWHVSQGSEKVYICLAVGGNAANTLAIQNSLALYAGSWILPFFIRPAYELR
jgi:hypothetical protein